MIAVDTNVLVYAHRAGSSHHEWAAEWLRFLAEGPVPWGLPVFVLGEFVRVVTHPKIFAEPSSVDVAFDFLAAVRDSPTARLLVPAEGFPRLFEECVRGAEARGNLAFDAQIAAVCREGGAAKLLTRDRDFLRFPGLETVVMKGPPRE